ncbi:tRNA-dependent cyclodipeptide synthase [Photorhabdus laumondii subsp. laumondii]|uniref:Cyclodipeptide synthase n=1 Tax=Photorhabdus laumondii subsp. laumondii TaxID=141679 RepID=A0A6L9JM33_PHOLM|nr:tRNA-dependent cyclodipeptide synthase [Photorhabdus laumondii subsp. laumondii]NDK94300.1 tRNA-dependent cyclodipeptide synthase [Photorhabdus laumondii subsp. laumondii]NDL20065.1 tRNA-dependent cyclodipeptide synthase [Photorhabdus laumondii subsp. laumondii]NDL29536.1 tRNA-dependent cyclodipeptide synthase [Photorhabdus laumondii subsp. laumondii]NDL34252.1 tRNA-dependent cyclodipeptide synthase [Photorhabdus laumondii subsp. laumondii]
MLSAHSTLLHENSPSFTVQGETSRCDQIIQKGDHALIGISPFNSRFSKDYVVDLIQWSSHYFRQVDILLPCEREASRLLVASGIDNVKAIKKTHREIRRHLRNLDYVISTATLKSKQIRVIQFSDFSLNHDYQSLKTQVENAFNESESFKKSCLDMSFQAIKGRLKGTGQYFGQIDLQLVYKALPYIFAEIPFYLNTPRLLGVKYSTLLYHRPWSIGKGLFNGSYPIQVADKQSYGIVTQL